MGVDSGLVSLARRLDHEEQHHYSLTVTATDGVHTTSTKVSAQGRHEIALSDAEYKRICEHNSDFVCIASVLWRDG